MPEFDRVEANGRRGGAAFHALSEVRVATVSVDVTPVEPSPLAGYTRSGNWTAVGMPLEGNFLIFLGDGGVFVFGSIDTLFLEQGFVDSVAEAAGVDPVRILLVASHTHNAPSLSRSTPLLGEFDPGYGALAVERIGKAVADAIGDGGSVCEFSFTSRPGKYNISRRKPSLIADYAPLRRGKLPNLWRGVALSENRNGFVDRNIYVLPVFVGNRVKCIIWSLAAHPAFYPDLFSVSSDFPGTVRRMLRDAFGEDVAVLFLPGFAGSAIPRMPRALPRTAKQIMLRCLPFQQKMRTFSRKTYLHYCQNLSRDIGSLVRAAGSRSRLETCAFSWAAEMDVFREGNGNLASLSAFEIELNENSRVIALSGEIVGEWDKILRAKQDQILTGYAPGRPIYVPTADQMLDGGYEVDGFRPHFSLDGDFLPDYQKSIVCGIRDLENKSDKRKSDTDNVE